MIKVAVAQNIAVLRRVALEGIAAEGADVVAKIIAKATGRFTRVDSDSDSSDSDREVQL